GKTLSLPTSAYESLYFSSGKADGWYNFDDRDINVRLGLQITSTSNPDFTPQFVPVNVYSKSDYELKSGYGLSGRQATSTLPALPDGEYKLTMSTLDLNYPTEVIEAMKVPVGYSNYVTLSVNNGNYTVKDIPTYKISMSDGKIDSDLYYGRRVMMSAKLKNDSPMQLTEGITPRLYEGNTVRFEGESILVALNPGEEKEIEWVSSFTLVKGGAITSPTEFTLAFYNPETGRNLGTYGTVTMQPSSRLNMMMSGFSITGAERFNNVDVDGKNYIVLQKVPDPSNIEFNISYIVKSGFFDSLVRMSIEKMEHGIATPYRDDIYAEWQMQPASETPVDIKLNVDMSDADMNSVYALVATYTSGYSQNSFGTYYFMLKDLLAGINEVELDKDVKVELYNLQGQKIENPEKGDIVIVRKGNRSEKMVW
ncbi:MAG: hypothetical protein K2H18_01985, partial [Muribaculaceae bacterium]|nr:hypothetical protein [Muribaculaceae bacterium]